MNKTASLFVLLAACAAGPVDAQTQAPAPPPPRCESAEFHAFDFWIGAWTVHDATGRLLGYNSIKPIATGCGLLEHWRGAQSGAEGLSINAYDAALGGWTQRWVGASATLWLAGDIVGDAMVLTSTAPRTLRSGDSVRDRITWTPLPDGRVRQFWEVSVDGGEWQPTFEGFYSRGGTGGGAAVGGRRPHSSDF